MVKCCSPVGQTHWHHHHRQRSHGSELSAVRRCTGGFPLSLADLYVINRPYTQAGPSCGPHSRAATRCRRGGECSALLRLTVATGLGVLLRRARGRARGVRRARRRRPYTNVRFRKPNVRQPTRASARARGPNASTRRHGQWTYACERRVVDGVDLEVCVELSAFCAYYLSFRVLGLAFLPLKRWVGSRGVAVLE